MTRSFRSTLAAAVLTLLPFQAAQAKDMLYLNGLGNTWVVDGDTFKVVQTIKTQGLTQGMVTSEDAKTLYLITGQRERLEVVERATGKILETISFSEPGKAHARMYGCTVIKDRLYVYLTTSRFDGWEDGKMDHFHLAEPEIVAIDLKTKQKVARLAMPLGILYLEPVDGGKRIYAMGRDIYDIDAETLKVRRVMPLDPPPVEGEGQISINAEWVHPETADGMSAYPYFGTDPITKRTTTGLLTLDNKDGTIDHFELGPPVGNQFGFSAVILPDRKRSFMVMNKFFEIDMAKRRVTRVKDYGKTYYGLTASPDGKRIYMTAAGATISEVDPDTLEIRRSMDLPAEVWDVTVLPAEGGPAPEAATK